MGGHCVRSSQTVPKIIIYTSISLSDGKIRICIVRSPTHFLSTAFHQQMQSAKTKPMPAEQLTRNLALKLHYYQPQVKKKISPKELHECQFTMSGVSLHCWGVHETPRAPTIYRHTCSPPSTSYRVIFGP